MNKNKIYHVIKNPKLFITGKGIKALADIGINIEKGTNYKIKLIEGVYLKIDLKKDKEV